MDIHCESENGTPDNNSSCISVSNQYLQVNLPIDINACADLKYATVSCGSNPEVTVCKPSENSSEYELVIIQKVTIAIPIKYIAGIKCGDLLVEHTKE